MCNLYNLMVERWELQAYYQANDDFRGDIERGEVAKDYVSKATPGLIVRQVKGQRILSEPLHWGWPNPRGGDEVRNARNYGSRFWKPALENPERRCLVPWKSRKRRLPRTSLARCIPRRSRSFFTMRISTVG